MTKINPQKETAQILRQELKQNFPNSSLEEFYEEWTRNLINSDRLHEILPYKIWRQEIAPNYRTFVEQCLSSRAYSEIF